MKIFNEEIDEISLGKRQISQHFKCHILHVFSLRTMLKLSHDVQDREMGK